MTRSGPTGRAYRDSLVTIRGQLPDAAHAITTHVTHLERLLARARSEQSGLEQRVRELVEIAAENHGDGSGLIVVEDDSKPVAVSDMPRIHATAERLVRDLLAVTAVDVGASITNASIISGPLSTTVFSTALRLMTEQMRGVFKLPTTTDESTVSTSGEDT